MTRTPVLELADVTFRREGKQIIDGISLTVRAGEHWALLGPNGAGKSTLLGFCGAVTFPTTGTVRVFGEQLGRVELARLRHAIGHVNPRHPLQYPLTIRQVVLTGITATINTPMRWTPTADELRRADAMIDTVGLKGKADDTWPTLSQGERGWFYRSSTTSLTGGSVVGGVVQGRSQRVLFSTSSVNNTARVPSSLASQRSCHVCPGCCTR